MIDPRIAQPLERALDAQARASVRLDAGWPAHSRVRGFSTLRQGLNVGVSRPPFNDFNLGAYCGDEPQAVATNRAALGWAADELDEFVVHQISKVHTAAMVDLLGIAPEKVLTVFPQHGNIGPASVPIALSKLNELGRLVKGKRIALMGIGSGLNCSMAEVEW